MYINFLFKKLFYDANTIVIFIWWMNEQVHKGSDIYARNASKVHTPNISIKYEEKPPNFYVGVTNKFE